MQRRNFFKGLLALAVAPLAAKFAKAADSRLTVEQLRRAKAQLSGPDAMPGEIGRLASCQIEEETYVGTTEVWTGTRVPRSIKFYRYCIECSNAGHTQEHCPHFDRSMFA